MGKLRSYLSQVQDFIASPITRNVMLNDLYQEALEVLFNDNKEPPTEAVVLKVFPQNQTADELKDGEQQFQSAVLRVPGLHDCIPDPVRLVKDSTNGEVNNSIQIHGVYFSKEPLASVDGAESESVLLQVGHVVPIEFIDGVIRFGIPKRKNPDYAKLQFISEKTEDQGLIVDEQEIQSKFKGREVVTIEDFVGPPLPSQTPSPVVYNNVIEEIESKIPISQGVIEYKTSLRNLTKRVEEEYKIWKNKKEKDPSVYNTLKKYWDNVGWNEKGGKDPVWTPAGVPWSAAFISWIVGDQFFPKAAAHYKYSYDALYNRQAKKGKWWLFSLKREKVKINVGDIFVKTRSNGSKEQYNNSHGDMVWKIENNIAYLTGGNVGGSRSGTQTMSIKIKINLNKDGTPKSTGKYIILVKRIE